MSGDINDKDKLERAFNSDSLESIEVALEKDPRVILAELKEKSNFFVEAIRKLTSQLTEVKFNSNATTDDVELLTEHNSKLERKVNKAIANIDQAVGDVEQLKIIAQIVNDMTESHASLNRKVSKLQEEIENIKTKRLSLGSVILGIGLLGIAIAIYFDGNGFDIPSHLQQRMEFFEMEIRSIKGRVNTIETE